jgi:hypothetical protein
MICASHYVLLVFPLCPESAPRGWTQSVVREHVLAWANRFPHGTYASWITDGRQPLAIPCLAVSVILVNCLPSKSDRSPPYHLGLNLSCIV